MLTRPRHPRLMRGIVLAAIVMALLAVERSWATHLSWMAPYRNHGNESCCADQDCRPADVALLHPSGTVRVDGVVLRLHPAQVHQVPRDVDQSTGWWCWKGSPFVITPDTTRCVFYVIHPGQG